ncbi:hypothetical protein [Pseudobutyrivibrio sp.]|uniref:hypothetical protein n=1 Tax=Pseudobutyrivibrio sp. TaxID=2014367 RepID=UPI0025E12101|nr:hypothetical protein [Pseudobutyrivibrio sp.]MBR5649657.1 hypothetical protein [Pseudobutyrivibrio sp.]
MTIQSGINTAQYKNSFNQMNTVEAKHSKATREISTGKEISKGAEDSAASTFMNNKNESSSLNTNSNAIKQIDALSLMSELENFNI